MIIEHIEQRSPEWYAIRRGVITASSAHRLLTPAKRDTYARELLAEQLSNEIPESYTSAAMQWGIDTEPSARAVYEMTTGNRIEPIGFAWLDEEKTIGCSPDGFVGTQGMIEIKCPMTHTHLGYVLDRKAPADYQAQMQLQMLICERDWCDFVSYDPRLLDHDLLRLTYEPDLELQDKLMTGATEVLNKIAVWRAELRR